MCCEKWSHVAEMFLFFEDREKDYKIHCLCTRAFVEDRKLCNLGLKGYYIRGSSNNAGDQATEEEEDDYSHCTAESFENKGIDLDESELDSEAELMRSMGLPLQFGRVSEHNNFEASINMLLLFLNKVKVKKKKTKHQKKYLDEIMQESWRKEYEEDDLLLSDDPSSVEQYENIRTCELQSKKDIKAENLLVENTLSPNLEITEIWEKYWNKYGEGLLWQSWQEKHPDQTLSSEPWNFPDTKEEWEQHYSQLYWYYLEQFQYWEAQGWTFDASQSCDTDTCTAKTEVDNKKNESSAKIDLTSFPSLPDTVDKESSGSSDHNEILDGINNITLSSEEVEQSQLDSVSCNGQLSEVYSGKVCPASGQNEPCNGGTKASNLSGNRSTDEPAQEKFLKWISEPVDEEALQESFSHDNIQDSCTSSDSEKQDMPVKKADDLMETRSLEPEKCQAISSASEPETEKNERHSPVAAIPEKQNCVAQETPDFPQVDTKAEIKKKKKKNKNRKVNGMPPEIAAVPELIKYWAQRYRLFSRFDDGIKLDRGKVYVYLILF
ncbi:Trimethylguanosine synthase [Heterocephalus glaber]|uniref:Trimethylguanosine synthase n=1 Tax=Heterocephalus glaber TaxID=10181 RepID=G5C0F1_HETGA|nr:Trimethylguanosine synthase [Heterocephalus glaber]